MKYALLTFSLSLLTIAPALAGQHKVLMALECIPQVSLKSIGAGGAVIKAVGKYAINETKSGFKATNKVLTKI